MLQDTQSYCFIQINTLDRSTATYTHTTPAPQPTSSAYGATRLTAIPALGLKLHGEKNRKRMNFKLATESSTSLPVGWRSIENANVEPQSNLSSNTRLESIADFAIRIYSHCNNRNCNSFAKTSSLVASSVSDGHLYEIFGCVQMCFPFLIKCNAMMTTSLCI